MAQLSRTYQVALAAVAVLALLWFALLRSHGQPGHAGPAGAQTSSGSAAPASGSSSKAGTAAEEAKQAAAPTPEYHGAIPGMKGLSRAVRKAHETVGASQREAAAIESAAPQSGTSVGTGGASTVTTGGTQANGGARSHTSTQGTGVQAHSPAGSRSVARGGASTTVTKASTGSGASSRTHPASGHRSSAKAQSGHPGAHTRKGPSRPAQIAQELHSGKVVLLLFWNPKSADDVSVHHQIGVVSHSLKGKVAVHYARAREVGSFGTVTRNIDVNQTPTLLVISRKGLVTTITGLTDSFSIKQAIEEANG